jgi:hypothetical protein
MPSALALTAASPPNVCDRLRRGGDDIETVDSVESGEWRTTLVSPGRGQFLHVRRVNAQAGRLTEKLGTAHRSKSPQVRPSGACLRCPVPCGRRPSGRRAAGLGCLPILTHGLPDIMQLSAQRFEGQLIEGAVIRRGLREDHRGEAAMIRMASSRSDRRSGFLTRRLPVIWKMTTWTAPLANYVSCVSLV